MDLRVEIPCRSSPVPQPNGTHLQKWIIPFLIAMLCLCIYYILHLHTSVIRWDKKDIYDLRKEINDLKKEIHHLSEINERCRNNIQKLNERLDELMSGDDVSGTEIPRSTFKPKCERLADGKKSNEDCIEEKEGSGDLHDDANKPCCG